MHWKKNVRRFHRLFSVIIGVQILFWTVSGAYFAIVPIDTVRGKDRVAATSGPRDPLKLTEALLNPTDVLNRTQLEGVTEIRLTDFRGVPTYALHTDKPKYPAQLVHGYTGQPVAMLTPDEAQTAAAADYGDTFEPRGTPTLLDTAPPEYGGPLPVYRVEVDDARRTHLYIHPVDGRVMARRNRFWRIFDFLWMLHILDFDEREDFNNNLLRTVSVGGLILVLSGYLLWASSRRWKQKS